MGGLCAGGAGLAGRRSLSAGEGAGIRSSDGGAAWGDWGGGGASEWAPDSCLGRVLVASLGWVANVSLARVRPSEVCVGVSCARAIVVGCAEDGGCSDCPRLVVRLVTRFTIVGADATSGALRYSSLISGRTPGM